MSSFKLIASRSGKVVFDERIEAGTPREAREKMKAALGLQSLSGLVYAITEIPVEIIRDIVSGQMAQAIVKTRGGGRRIDVEALIWAAVQSATAAMLSGVERRLAAIEAHANGWRSDTGGNGGGALKRHDPLAQASGGNTATHEVRAKEPPRAIPERIRAIVGPDWRAIRKQYRTTRSVKQTAAQFDVSVNTLKARIRREGWAK